MSVTLSCPNCRKTLSLPDAARGKKARCPACQTVFVVPVSEAIQATVPKPPPLPSVELASAPEEGITERPRRRDRTRVTEREEDYQEEPAQRLEIKVQVKKDPAKELKGVFTCKVTRKGMRLQQKKKDDVVIPLGTPVQLAGPNHLLVEWEDREVELAVSDATLYQKRLARDLVQFLQGQGPLPRRKDYTVPPYLYIPAVLPLGIPIMTLGGALPGALGFGLMAGNFAIMRNEDMSVGVRLTLTLLLTILGYAAIGVLLFMALRR